MAENILSFYLQSVSLVPRELSTGGDGVSYMTYYSMAVLIYSDYFYNDHILHLEFFTILKKCNLTLTRAHLLYVFLYVICVCGLDWTEIHLKIIHYKMILSCTDA